MGVSAAIALASTVGGAVLNKMMAPKIDTPQATAMPKQDEKATKDAATDAAAQARKRAQAAGGRSDTILTGSQGLGELGAENTQKTTLLGY